MTLYFLLKLENRKASKEMYFPLLAFVLSVIGFPYKMNRSFLSTMRS